METRMKTEFMIQKLDQWWFRLLGASAQSPGKGAPVAAAAGVAKPALELRGKMKGWRGRIYSLTVQRPDCQLTDSTDLPFTCTVN